MIHAGDLRIMVVCGELYYTTGLPFFQHELPTELLPLHRKID